MRGLFVFLIFILFLVSCSRTFNGLIRNGTEQSATIDVYLIRKNKMHSLPNQVRIGKYLDNFKKRDLDSVNSIDTVDWIDLNHFRYTIRPKSVLLLQDLGIILENGLVFSDVIAVFKSGGQTDSIKAGWRVLNQFKNVNGILCYDIKNGSR